MTKVVWKHEKTGGLYSIVAFAIEEATLEPVVVYQKIGEKRMWTRPCNDFFDGRFTPQAADAAEPAQSVEVKNIFVEEGQVARRDTRMSLG